MAAARAHAQSLDASPPPADQVYATPAIQDHAIAVVASAERPALVARLHAELADLGIRIEETPPDLDPEALDALTDGAHFLALVRVDEAGQAIELRIRTSESGELLRDRIPLRPQRADVAAVATAELLRARLIKLGILQAPPVPLPPAPLPPPPAPPPSFPSLTADINAGVWYSAGGLGASPAMGLGLRVHPTRWLALGALGAFEPQTSDFSASEGQAHSRATILGVLTDFGFAAGRTHFELGGGVALSILSLSGEADSPFAGRSTSSYGIAPLVRANLGVRLAGPVSLHTELVGGVSSPRVAVHFADRTVAHWGRPLTLALIGLEVGF